MEDQPTATPVSAESRSTDSLIVLPLRLPIQEQSRGALNNAIFSVGAATLNQEVGMQWQRLKELLTD